MIKIKKICNEILHEIPTLQTNESKKIILLPLRPREFKCCSLNNSEYMIPLGVQHQRDYIELGS